MTGTLRWTLGLGASVLAHVVAALALPGLVDPRPPPDQPPPRSQMRIETQEVARSQSDALPQEPESLSEAAAAATRLDSGTVPQSRSDGIAPPAASLAAAAMPSLPLAAAMAEAAVLAASDGPAQPLPAAAPATARVAQASAPVLPARAAPPPVQTAAARPPDSAEAMPVAPDSAQASPVAPDGAQAMPVAPDGAQAISVAPDGVAAPSREPASTATRPADLPAARLGSRAATAEALAAGMPETTRATAALAWSGDAGTRIDPQSLATIQSFMLPGDAVRQGSELRDALGALLEGVPCARLQAVFDPATGSLGLRGHIPEDGLRAPVLAALQAQVGSGIPLRDEMLILPRPQCGALSGIAAVGLPQSTDQDTNPLLVGADAHARAYDYRQGERLVFDLAAPDYDAVIYVDYFDADGQVIHLVPNEVVPLRMHPAQGAFRIGAGDDGGPFLDITIGPPYGQEIAAAFAASIPLYDGLRPMTEPAAPYLEWLGERVAAARAADPEFRGEWVYFFVTTRPE